MAGVSVQFPIAEAVYFKQEDYDRQLGDRSLSDCRLTPLMVCHSLGRCLKRGCTLEGAQLLQGVWCVYAKTTADREALLETRRHLVGPRAVPVELLDSNPTPPPRPRSKIIYIRDLPLYVTSERVLQYLGTCGVYLKPSAVVGFVTELDEGGGLTDIKNGDRFVHAESPVEFPLPREACIGDDMCRVYHDGQSTGYPAEGDGLTPRDGAPLGRNCLNNVTSFRGRDAPLSNFFACRLRVFDKEFESSEHAYQWCKAVMARQDDVAEKILRASGARAAKALSKEIDNNKIPDTRLDRRKLMTYLVKAKAIQCDEFFHALTQAKDFIAEANFDFLWATGLMEQESNDTVPQFWPGYNLLGRIHMEVRKWLRENGRDVTMSDLDPYPSLGELRRPVNVSRKVVGIPQNLFDKNVHPFQGGNTRNSENYGVKRKWGTGSAVGGEDASEDKGRGIR